MAAGDLTTLANVKAWLGLTADTTDELLRRLISAVSGFIQRDIGRQIASQAYTETRNGHGGSQLAFANSPVTAVASVKVNGLAIPAAVNFDNFGYRFTGTALVLNGHCFTRGYGNIYLAYTAGYAATPPELEQACLELLAVRYKERDHVGQDAASMQGQNITFSTRDMPQSVKTILNNWKKVAPL